MYTVHRVAAVGGTRAAARPRGVLARRFDRFTLRRFADQPPLPAKRARGRAWVALPVALVGGVGGAVAFRDEIEKRFPATTPYYRAVYDRIAPPKPPPPSAEVVIPRAIRANNADEEKPAGVEADGQAKEAIVEGGGGGGGGGETTTTRPAVQPKSDEQVRAEIARDEAARSKALREMDARVSSSMSTVTTAVTSAEVATSAVVDQMLKHARLLRDAVDEPQEPRWAAVTEAKKALDAAQRSARQAETDAKNYLDMLRTVVNQGRASTLTAESPAVLEASRHLNRLTDLLDDTLAKVEATKTECRLISEYQQLVEDSRRRFAAELNAILPHVDLRAKDSTLSVEDLNGLIAHAHLRIDHVRKQLVDQQLREKQNLAAALETQQAEDARRFDERLQAEISRQRRDAAVDAEAQLVDARAKFEEELRAQLRRAAAAHSEHLEEVVGVQRRLLDAAHEASLAEALRRERDRFHSEMAAALSRLRGIEAALESRAVQDADNRRAKELWLACQNLVDSVVFGRRGAADMEARRKALANEVMTIKECSSDDAFVKTMVSEIPDEALFDGVYTDEDLRERFWKVRRVCARTAMVGEGGASLLKYVASWLQSLLVVDLGVASFSVDDAVSADALDTFAILRRARYFIFEKDDYATAIRLMNLLRGEAARAASGWIRDTRRHLETRQAAELLLSHVAAISLRTVY